MTEPNLPARLARHTDEYVRGYRDGIAAAEAKIQRWMERRDKSEIVRTPEMDWQITTADHMRRLVGRLHCTPPAVPEAKGESEMSEKFTDWKARYEHYERTLSATVLENEKTTKRMRAAGICVWTCPTGEIRFDPTRSAAPPAVPGESEVPR